MDHEALLEILSYDSKTGIFTWKNRTDRHLSAKIVSSWNSRYTGKEAFTNTDRKGYRTGSIFGKMVKAHRVAWFYVYGEWPEDQIDHINGDRSDNRISNMREATNQDNQRNAGLSQRNKSGVVGVHWRSSRSRWFASINNGGRLVTIGSYVSFDDAVKARRDAEYKYGYHEGHGKRPAAPPHMQNSS